jgi:hypothetical protein
MKDYTTEDISFDDEDAKLFLLDTDLILKAKSIQYSIKPKLDALLKIAISRFRKVYDIEVFSDDSIIHSWPSFREKRDNELKVDYSSAFVGISGARRAIWKGFKKSDNDKPVKIIPYRYGFEFSNDGLSLTFFNDTKLKLVP